MRTLLRAKIWCDARSTVMFLISPVGDSVNWTSASPFSMPWRCASRGKATSPITVWKLEQTTPAETGAGGAAGAGAAATTGGGAGAMTTGAGGGVGVVAVIVGAGGGAAIW